MGVADTIMAGRYSATDMAAVAIGFSITLPVLCFVQGLAMALTPIISRLHGANLKTHIVKETYQCFYLVLPIAFLMSLLIIFVPDWFSLVPMESELREITVDYVTFILYAIPVFAVYQVLRNFCEGLSITKPTMIIMGVGLLVNIPANYILIYGEFGAPEMGGAGCGLATALVFSAMMVSTAIYAVYSKSTHKYQIFQHIFPPRIAEMLVIFKLGLPIALTLLFEVTLFGVVALLLSPFGSETVASHQITLNFSSLVFMFPLSVGMATSIRVSYLLGKNDPKGAKLAAHTAVVFGLIIAAFTAFITIVARQNIALLYTADTQIIELAMSLLLLASMFQLSDAIQAISAGALRGYKDTTAMLLITFVSYWLIGFPIGILLALTDVLFDALGARGFWIGFICGLTSAAIMLGLRVRYIQRVYFNQ